MCFTSQTRPIYFSKQHKITKSLHYVKRVHSQFTNKLLHTNYVTYKILLQCPQNTHLQTNKSPQNNNTNTLTNTDYMHATP